MEMVSTVVAALVAGGTAGVSAMASTMVADAYQSLKERVLGRLRAGGVDDAEAARLIDDVTGATAGREKMQAQLADTGVDDETVAAAQRLLELLKDTGKYHITLHDAKGVIVGDHSVQHNTFN